jgi:hypothetical protein
MDFGLGAMSFATECGDGFMLALWSAGAFSSFCFIF